MKNIKNQIDCDLHNIQELINLLPHCETKGRYRSVCANIKILVKEVRNQKILITEQLFTSTARIDPKLFEVQPSELTDIDIFEEYKDIDSYFGKIELLEDSLD